MPNRAPRALLQSRNCQNWSKTTIKQLPSKIWLETWFCWHQWNSVRGYIDNRHPTSYMKKLIWPDFHGGAWGPRGPKWDLVRVWACYTSKQSTWQGDSHATIFRSLTPKMRPPEPKNPKIGQNCTFWYYSGQFSQSMGLLYIKMDVWRRDLICTHFLVPPTKIVAVRAKN